MEKAKRRFIYAIRENKQFKKDALEFVDAVERYINTLEFESSEKDFAISRLLKEINLYVDIMKSYGIDTDKLGGQSIYRIMEQVDAYESHKTFTIPEKLISHDKRKRPTRSEGLSILPRCKGGHPRVFGRNKRTGEGGNYSLADLR